MTTALQFENVSKRFTATHRRARHLQDVAISILRLGRTTEDEEFWALRDFNLEVSPGEMVGVIGQNGAGKSTVLKLISRIVEPSSGRIVIGGRVGALLELGTGFHPDLTGRENVYLNGAILGLTRSEIKQNLDSIIEFAEIDRFIDVAVKHYSSGMLVRLGFSVAIHTEPEILLVDEVLAVGDIPFQRKCLEHIELMRRKGTTLLIVSHDLDSIRNLCDRVVWLEEGTIMADGQPEIVVRQYLRHTRSEGSALAQAGAARRQGSGDVSINQLRLLDDLDEKREIFFTGQPFVVDISYTAEQRISQPVFGLTIHRSDGMRVAEPNTQSVGFEVLCAEGAGKIRYTVPSLPLLEGSYVLSVSARDREGTHLFDHHDRMYPFQVQTTGSKHEGFITLLGEWSCPEVE